MGEHRDPKPARWWWRTCADCSTAGSSKAANACPPNASWHERWASAGRASGQACGRSRKWASCGSAGAGSFIAGGPPVFGTDALRFQAALHGFTRDQMFQARLVLEVAVAGSRRGMRRRKT